MRDDTWNIYTYTPEGKRQILYAGVPRSKAMAWRIVFPWCFVERQEVNRG